MVVCCSEADAEDSAPGGSERFASWLCPGATLTVIPNQNERRRRGTKRFAKGDRQCGCLMAADEFLTASRRDRRNPASCRPTCSAAGLRESDQVHPWTPSRSLRRRTPATGVTARWDVTGMGRVLADRPGDVHDQVFPVDTGRGS